MFIIVPSLFPEHCSIREGVFDYFFYMAMKGIRACPGLDAVHTDPKCACIVFQRQRKRNSPFQCFHMIAVYTPDGGYILAASKDTRCFGTRIAEDLFFCADAFNLAFPHDGYSVCHTVYLVPVVGYQQDSFPKPADDLTDFLLH